MHIWELRAPEFQSPYNEEVTITPNGVLRKSVFMFQSPYNEEVAILIGI